MLIDGVVVVNDDANHSFRFTPGTVYLAEGGHALEIQYIELNYSQGLVATWRGPTVEYEEVIPAEAFAGPSGVRIVRWRETGPDEE